MSNEYLAPTGQLLNETDTIQVLTPFGSLLNETVTQAGGVPKTTHLLLLGVG
jgi:hypothetical protein